MSLFCVAAPAVVGGKVTSGMIRISIEKFNSVDFIAEEIGFYMRDHIIMICHIIRFVDSYNGEIVLGEKHKRKNLQIKVGRPDLTEPNLTWSG